MSSWAAAKTTKRQNSTSKTPLTDGHFNAYLQQITAKPILLTGGSPFGVRSEADAMAETLHRDFHKKDVWIEDPSKDTSENAAFSAAILKQQAIQRVAIVSQARYLPRAIQLLEQQSLTVYPTPIGYPNEDNDPFIRWLPKASALDISSMALKEYPGRIFSASKN